MGEPFIVALVQAPAYGDAPSFDTRANLAGYVERIDECCRQLSPALVVLPELFTTPYFCSSHDPRYRDLAEPIPGPATDALGELARAHGAYITVPIFERAGDGREYDSCALVGPDGGVCEMHVVGSDEVFPAARKVHVPKVEAFGTSLDEKFWFEAGPGLAYADTGLGRLGFLICYDRSFPEAWRTLVLAGAELVVVPVTSSGFREELFLAELRTRAAENGVFAAACNRVGPERVEADVRMYGSSCVLSPLGEVLARASSTEPEVVTATVDLASAAAVRADLPLLEDRRPELYRL
jgi:predicted amidohydrolase